MPRYLPDHTVGYSYGRGAVAARPELAAMIGIIAGDWAIVERCITEIYALLLGWDMPPSDFEPSLELHHVGIQIFEYLPALKQRTELLSKLSKSTLPADEYKLLVDKTIPTILKGSKSRNKVLHSVWGIMNDYSDDLIRVSSGVRRELWGKNEFKAESLLVLAAHEATSDYFHLVHRLRLTNQRRRFPVPQSD